MDLELAAAHWSLRRLRSDQLPEIATEALVQGFDSPSLRILAGEYRPKMEEVGPLFVKSLKELGIAIPAPRDAALKFIRIEAQKIMSGDCTPYRGACNIESIAYRLNKSDFDSLFELTRPFLGAVSELEGYMSRRGKRDYPEKVRQKALQFEEPIIIEAAKKVLSETASIFDENSGE